MTTIDTDLIASVVRRLTPTDIRPEYVVGASCEDQQGNEIVVKPDEYLDFLNGEGRFASMQRPQVTINIAEMEQDAYAAITLILLEVEALKA